MTTTPNTALVTGATGLLGNAVVRQLLDAGTEVTAVVRDAGRARALLPNHPALRLVTGDITDVAGFAHALQGVDVIFHTAAYFREYYQPGSDLRLLHRTNVEAVGELMRSAVNAGVPALVHTSSIAVLGGGTPQNPGDEDTPNAVPDDRRNAYGASKIRAEELIADFCARHPLRVPLILPGWMWGPGDAGPTSAGRLFLALARGEVKALPRAGNHLVDARDVAAACIAAAVRGTGGRRYIVAGAWHSLQELVAGVVRATGADRVPRELPAAAAMTAAAALEWQARLRGKPPVATRTGMRVLMEGTHRRVVSARARSELDVVFRPLEQTLADQAAWHRDRGQLAAAVRDTETE